MPIKIKSKKNIMDFIPVKNDKFQWAKAEDGRVQIMIQRNGILDKIVRKFRKISDTFKVNLDEFGTFVWLQIDGERDIYEIGNLLKEKYGEQMEHPHIRVGQFMNLLKNNKFISFKDISS